jgi:hypothetical protein
MSRIIPLFLFFCLVIYACEKDPVCGCKGTPTNAINDDLAIVSDSDIGTIVISGTYGIFELCDPPPALEKGMLIKFDGGVLSHCVGSYSYDPYKVVMYRHIKMRTYDTLLSSDNIYNAGVVEIVLIKSEDFGYSTGFGYKINSGFIRITQPYIPGASGFQTFKSPEDALKVALLVSAKIQMFKDLPSLTEEELKFIHIL